MDEYQWMDEYQCMVEWMEEWMDINEWLNFNEWMNGLMNGWMDEWIDEWMNGLMNGWMDWWMDGYRRMDERNSSLIFWCLFEISNANKLAKDAEEQLKNELMDLWCHVTSEDLPMFYFRIGVDYISYAGKMLLVNKAQSVSTSPLVLHSCSLFWPFP